MSKRNIQEELNGDWGLVRQQMTQACLDKMKDELARGEYTFNEAGVAYNCIGRVVLDDVADMLSLITDKIDVTATKFARRKADHEDFQKYKANLDRRIDENIAEMRAAFGDGETVVNIITGERIHL